MCPFLNQSSFQKSGLSQSATTFERESRINSIQNRRDGNQGSSDFTKECLEGKWMLDSQYIYSKGLVESSIMYVWSTYCMLTIVVDILYTSNSLSANENSMRYCYFFLSPG